MYWSMEAVDACGSRGMLRVYSKEEMVSLQSAVIGLHVHYTGNYGISQGKQKGRSSVEMRGTTSHLKTFRNAISKMCQLPLKCQK